MIYPVKNEDDLDALIKLGTMNPQVENIRSQELRQEIFHHETFKVYEPIMKAMGSANENFDSSSEKQTSILGFTWKEIQI